MACLDHECKKCGAEWSDNRWPRVCPECGSTEGYTWSDEIPETEAFRRKGGDD